MWLDCASTVTLLLLCVIVVVILTKNKKRKQKERIASFGNLHTRLPIMSFSLTFYRITELNLRQVVRFRPPLFLRFPPFVGLDFVIFPVIAFEPNFYMIGFGFRRFCVCIVMCWQSH